MKILAALFSKPNCGRRAGIGAGKGYNGRIARAGPGNRWRIVPAGYNESNLPELRHPVTRGRLIYEALEDQYSCPQIDSCIAFRQR